jgi:hypothetical protein
MPAIHVVNIIPSSLSGEAFQDSEPNLAVNPANPLEIAGSAFTRDPGNGPNAPIYVSTDGGNTWTLNMTVPSQPDAAWKPGTGDITLRFGTNSNVLYAGILQWPGSFQLRILRTTNFTSSTPMTVLVSRGSVDQPYVQVATVMAGPGVGRDRVYVGDNDFAAAAGRTATADVSLDGVGATPPPPANFTTNRLDVRATAGQDAACVRPAVHFDGTIYIAFIGARTAGQDVVVVRDDHWGDSATPFQALVEPPAPSGDGQVGKRVVSGVSAWFGGSLGLERVGGSQLTIAVDPRDSSTVYVAWIELISGTWTLRVQRSTDRGQNWSGDLHTVPNATNPALAVNSRGLVGFLYQQLTGTAPNDRWETHLELTSNAWDTPATNQTLASVPASTPALAFNPYIGDYDHLLALGKDFYGIFSANNTPDVAANFPLGCTFQRNVNAATHQLVATDGVTPVAASIDPFFFRRTELTPATDFYVRDWTDSMTSADTGLEPSTHPWFFVTSDVWNRLTNAPGGFNAQNQPQNEDAQNGTGAAGHNFAFARVSRNASGSAATVTARFLVSPFGTGSVFAVVGSAAGTSVSFAATDLQVVSPGHSWHLAPTSSTHLCLAVEISTPNDPVATPGLAGRAPGFPTDLAVIYDNNKAQRNMGVVAGSSVGAVSLYAIIRNSQCRHRDVVMHVEQLPESRKLLRSQIGVVGGERVKVGEDGTFVLPEMEPGESRWLSISLRPSKTKAAIPPLIFHEVLENTPISGFAVTARALDVGPLAHANLVEHVFVVQRLVAAFGLKKIGRQVRAARALARKKVPAPKAYIDFLRASLEALTAAGDELVARGEDDPFGLRASLRGLAAAVEGGDAAAAGPGHATLLNKLDAFQTMLQKRAGDATEVLFNVEWQRCLFTEVERLREVSAGKKLVELGDRFIAEWDTGKANADSFPALIGESFDLLASVAEALPDVELSPLLEPLRSAMGSPAALQAAHRAYLLKLSQWAEEG